MTDVDLLLPVVELRQYVLHPGTRDTLIELFDREFIETQEVLGNMVIGQFRVIDDPNRFLWLRGFAGMPARKRGLADFYGGPVWKAHRDAANATMIDSDNVLLLRPARASSGIPLHERKEDAPRAHDARSPLFVVTVYSFDAPAGDDVVEYFEQTVAPGIERSGGRVSGYYVTESAANDYPQLPVRENENVFVWVASFADPGGYRPQPTPTLRLTSEPEVWKLAATSRSRLS